MAEMTNKCHKVVDKNVICSNFNIKLWPCELTKCGFKLLFLVVWLL